MRRNLIPFTIEDFKNYYGEIDPKETDVVNKALKDAENVVLVQLNQGNIIEDIAQSHLLMVDRVLIQEAIFTLAGWLLENGYFDKGSLSTSFGNKSISQAFAGDNQIAPVFYNLLEKTPYFKSYVRLNLYADEEEEIDLGPTTITSRVFTTQPEESIDGLATDQFNVNSQNVLKFGNIDNNIALINNDLTSQQNEIDAVEVEVAQLDTDKVETTTFNSSQQAQDLKINTNQANINTITQVLSQSSSQNHTTAVAGTYPLLIDEGATITPSFSVGTTGALFDIPANTNSIEIKADFPQLTLTIDVVVNNTTSAKKFQVLKNGSSFAEITIPAGITNYSIPLVFLANTMGSVYNLTFLLETGAGTATFNVAPIFNFFAFKTGTIGGIASSVIINDKDTMPANGINADLNKIDPIQAAFDPTNKTLGSAKYGYDVSGRPEINLASGSVGITLTETGVSHHGRRVLAIGNPVETGDAASKGYADSLINAADLVGLSTFTIANDHPEWFTDIGNGDLELNKTAPYLLFTITPNSNGTTFQSGFNLIKRLFDGSNNLHPVVLSIINPLLVVDKSKKKEEKESAKK